MKVHLRMGYVLTACPFLSANEIPSLGAFNQKIFNNLLIKLPLSVYLKDKLSFLKSKYFA